MSTVEQHASYDRRPDLGALPRWRRMVPPMAVAGGVSAMTVALHFRDPHVQGSWGLCPSAAMGFYCPGCGGLRAVNDLTNLQFADAASSNLFFIISIPFLLIGFGMWAWRRWSGRRLQLPMRQVDNAAIAVFVAMIGFAVVRNLPFGSWLAP